jgi:hypothetical protein
MNWKIQVIFPAAMALALTAVDARLLFVIPGAVAAITVILTLMNKESRSTSFCRRQPEGRA